MATKPQIPSHTVPPIGPDGKWNKEWYRFLSSLAIAGELSATAGASAGYETVTVNGQQKKRQIFEP